MSEENEKVIIAQLTALNQRMDVHLSLTKTIKRCLVFFVVITIICIVIGLIGGVVLSSVFGNLANDLGSLIKGF